MIQFAYPLTGNVFNMSLKQLIVTKSKSKLEMTAQLRMVDTRKLKRIFRYTDHGTNKIGLWNW